MMVAQQLSAGMTLSLNEALYRVEAVAKVPGAGGTTFIKVKLRHLGTDQVVEKNLKAGQKVTVVSPIERRLEFLYLEGKEYLFLDIDTLEQVLVPNGVIGDTIKYLKEGIELLASFYGEKIFSVELPQFLELMVAEVEDKKPHGAQMGAPIKVALLETGARLQVPPFIEAGDVVKVDTKSGDYVQRV